MRCLIFAFAFASLPFADVLAQQASGAAGGASTPRGVEVAALTEASTPVRTFTSSRAEEWIAKNPVPAARFSCEADAPIVRQNQCRVW
jgi:hypothetical protein